jgi:hypothetical protein
VYVGVDVCSILARVDSSDSGASTTANLGAVTSALSNLIEAGILTSPGCRDLLPAPSMDRVIEVNGKTGLATLVSRAQRTRCLYAVACRCNGQVSRPRGRCGGISGQTHR